MGLVEDDPKLTQLVNGLGSESPQGSSLVVSSALQLEVVVVKFSGADTAGTAVIFGPTGYQKYISKIRKT